MHLLDMDYQQMAADALWLTLLIAAVPMAVAFASAIIVGAFQAATQIQDSAVSFVPKFVAVGLSIVAMLSWTASELVRFTHALWSQLISVLI